MSASTRAAASAIRAASGTAPASASSTERARTGVGPHAPSATRTSATSPSSVNRIVAATDTVA